MQPVIHYCKNEAQEFWHDFKTLDINNPNFWVAANRIYNFSTFAFVSFGAFTTPNADPAEYADSLYHLYEFAIGKNAPWYLQAGALALNPLRIYQIATHLESGISTIPRVANYIDIANHCANLITRTYSWCKSSMLQKAHAA